MNTNNWLKSNYTRSEGLSIDDFNRLCEAVSQLCNMTVEPPLQINIDSAGIHIRLDDDGSSVVEAGGTFILNDASTTNITSNQNNLVIQGPIAPISTNGLYTITGIVPPSASGHMLWVYNAGTYPIVFAHQSASSTAANRFYFWNEQNQILMPGQFLSLHYNVSASRWYIVDFCKPIGGEKLATITLSTDLDNWALLGVANLKLPIIPVDPNGADRLLTGIANPIPGMVVGVRNVNGSDYLIAIKHESSSSTAANRISTPGANTVPIYPGDVAFFRYDGNSARWKLDSVPEPLIALPATPTAWGSNQDNLVIANRGRPEQRISASTPVNLTGIVAPPRDSEKLTFINVGSTHPITLIHDSTSTAANRFELPGGLPLILWPGDVVQVRYDLTLTRWTVIYTTAVIIRPEITQPIWGSNQNNWNPAIRSSEEQRISASSAVDLTGIVPVRDGERIALRNVGSETITLKNESASSTAAYRFGLPNSTDYPLYSGQTAKLVYDATAARWKLAATTPAVMVGDSGSGGTIGLVPAAGAGDAAALKALLADGTWGAPAATVAGLTEGEVLFGAADGTIDQDAGFEYDPATDTLLVPQIVSVGTATNYITIQSATDVGPRIVMVREESTGDPNLLTMQARTGPANLSADDIIWHATHEGYANGGYYGMGEVYVIYKGNGTTKLARMVFRTNAGSGLQSALELTEAGLVLVPSLSASEAVVTDGASQLDTVTGVTGTRTDGLTTDRGIVTAIGTPSTYSDEQAQDAVGAMVGGTTGLAYTDATPLLALNVTGLTGAEPALADELAGYDASGTATRKFQVDRLLGLARRSPGGRLTLGTGDPEYLGGSTSTTIYYTPYLHDLIELWDGTRWVESVFTEVSVSATHGYGTVFDVFGYLSSGALAIERLEWTDATTRATNVTYQDGRLCKSGDKTRLYLGTFCTYSGSNCEDSTSRRYLWNMYNRISKPMSVFNGTSHTYGTGSYRAWNSDTSNGYKFVCGRPATIHNVFGSVGYAAGGGATAVVAAGYDSTTTADSDLGYYVGHWDVSVYSFASSAGNKQVTTPGAHTVYMLEYSYGAGAYFHEMRLTGSMEF